MHIRRGNIRLAICLSLMLVSPVQSAGCEREAPEGCPQDTFCSNIWNRCTPCSEIEFICNNRSEILSRFQACDRYCGELQAKAKYAILQEKHADLEASNEELGRNLTNLEAKYRALEDDNQQLQANFTKLEAGYKDLEDDKERVRDNLVTLNETLQQEKAETAKLKKENENLKTLKGNLTKMHESCQNQNKVADGTITTTILVVVIVCLLAALLVSVGFNRCDRHRGSKLPVLPDFSPPSSSPRDWEENSEASQPLNVASPNDEAADPTAPPMEEDGYETGSTGGSASSHNGSGSPLDDPQQGRQCGLAPFPATADQENDNRREFALNKSYPTVAVQNVEQ